MNNFLNDILNLLISMKNTILYEYKLHFFIEDTMKLNTKDINNLLEDEESEYLTHSKVKSMTGVANKMQQMRNALAEKNENTRVYSNKDKTRFKKN